MRFGLVLGAGGGTGRAFHAGVLAALEETLGIDARDARVMVGTSAGAADAALLRGGIAPADLFARLVGRSCSPAGDALFARMPEWEEPIEEGPSGRWRPASPPRLYALMRRPWDVVPRTLGTVLAAVMPVGRRSTQIIEEAVSRLHEETWPRQPLWVCAVSLDDGRRVVFGRDADARAPVGRAVAASCAVPTYFAPVAIGDERYVDGGMHSPSNADLLAGLGLDVVIISSPQTAVPRALSPSVDAAFRSACRMLLRREAAELRRTGSRVLILEPTADDVRVMGSVAESMNVSRLADVAMQAYASTVRRCTAGPLARVVETAMFRRGQAALKRSAS
jgi:NTE family protein